MLSCYHANTAITERKGSIMQEKKDHEDRGPVHDPEELRVLLSFCRKLICSRNLESENVLIDGMYEDGNTSDFLIVRVLIDWKTLRRSDAKDEIETIYKYFDRMSDIIEKDEAS